MDSRCRLQLSSLPLASAQQSAQCWRAASRVRYKILYDPLLGRAERRKISGRPGGAWFGCPPGPGAIKEVESATVYWRAAWAKLHAPYITSPLSLSPSPSSPLAVCAEAGRSQFAKTGLGAIKTYSILGAVAPAWPAAARDIEATTHKGGPSLETFTAAPHWVAPRGGRAFRLSFAPQWAFRTRCCLRDKECKRERGKESCCCCCWSFWIRLQDVGGKINC